MTKISKQFIIIVAAIVFGSIILGLCISAVTQIGELKSEIDSLQSKISQIYNYSANSQGAINNLRNELLGLLNEQNKNYYDAAHKITSINAQNSTATVEIYFSLKESPVSGEVEVSYGTGSLYEKASAIKLVDGRYFVEIKAQIDRDYDVGYSVVLTSVKTEKILSFNVMNQLKNRINVSCGFFRENNGNWKLDFYLSNNYSNDVNLKAVTAKLEVYKDNVLVKTIDLKNYRIQSGDGYEEFGNKADSSYEISDTDFARSYIYSNFTVIDNYGIEYILDSK